MIGRKPFDEGDRVRLDRGRHVWTIEKVYPARAGWRAFISRGNGDDYRPMAIDTRDLVPAVEAATAA